MRLATPAAFFDQLRAGLLGPTLSVGELTGLDALLAALTPWPLAWAAYGLATAYHETAHTLQPVREVGGEPYFNRMYGPEGLRPAIAARLGNTQPGDGARYCGRGYVQLTGRGNYAHADARLTMVPGLEEQPDLALRPSIAAEILEAGMREGWFTGKGLGVYLPAAAGRAERDAFVQARRVINGQDRAGLVADYALRFQDALLLGRWA